MQMQNILELPQHILPSLVGFENVQSYYSLYTFIPSKQPKLAPSSFFFFRSNGSKRKSDCGVSVPFVTQSSFPQACILAPPLKWSKRMEILNLNWSFKRVGGGWRGKVRLWLLCVDFRKRRWWLLKIKKRKKKSIHLDPSVTDQVGICPADEEEICTQINCTVPRERAVLRCPDCRWLPTADASTEGDTAKGKK